MKIMKFGGTSLADAERIRQVAGLVADAARREQIGLVVSAVSGMTNHLLAAATAQPAPGTSTADERNVTPPGCAAPWRSTASRHAAICRALAEAGRCACASDAESPLEALSADLERLLEGVRLLGECPPAIRDRIAAFGEQASVLLVRQALEARGVSVFCVDPGEVIVTDEQFTDARVDYPATYDRFRALHDRTEDVLLMPGFIGRSASGRLTTLGRNGSDHSATIMGRGLHAAVVEIWTDVDGVMSADPRLVASAFVLPEVTYREAMEMAYFGASVIHPLTLVPVMDAGIPVRICNTLNPGAPGTWIRARAERPAEAGRGTEIVRAVTCTGDVSLLNVQGPGMTGVPGIAARVFQAMATRGINVIFISQASSEHSICFAVNAVIRRARGGGTPGRPGAGAARRARSTAVERRDALVDPLGHRRGHAGNEGHGGHALLRPGRRQRQHRGHRAGLLGAQHLGDHRFARRPPRAHRGARLLLRPHAGRAPLHPGRRAGGRRAGGADPRPAAPIAGAEGGRARLRPGPAGRHVAGHERPRPGGRLAGRGSTRRPGP